MLHLCSIHFDEDNVEVQSVVKKILIDFHSNASSKNSVDTSLPPPIRLPLNALFDVREMRQKIDSQMAFSRTTKIRH